MRFFGKIQCFILKSENGFGVSLLNRLIQDHSDHGTSKEPKLKSLPRMDSSVPLTLRDPSDLRLICLVKKRKIRFSKRNAPLVNILTVSSTPQILEFELIA